MHGFTYGGHTLSAAAAVATLNEVRRPEFLAGVRVTGAALIERLRALRSDFPCVGDVRGVGLMLGVEVEAERDTPAVARRALERGVVVRASGQKIVMSPPFVIEDEQADKVVDVLLEELRRL
jgi:validone 7-phosphate aminotransferase